MTYIFSSLNSFSDFRTLLSEPNAPLLSQAFLLPAFLVRGPHFVSLRIS